MRSMFALLRIVSWLKRLTLAVERLDAREQLKYERDYPPPGVDKPPRQAMVVSKPSVEEREALRQKRWAERMGGSNMDEV